MRRRDKCELGEKSIQKEREGKRYKRLKFNLAKKTPSVSRLREL